jgi:hypothetical protein
VLQSLDNWDDLMRMTVYTCQKPRDESERCKFFLWESDAKPQEERALLNHTRSEPERTNQTPSRPQRTSTPPPPYTTEARPSESTRKRTRPAVEDDEDEFGINQGGPNFDDELRVMANVETPTKAIKTEPYTTPRRNQPWDNAPNGLHTPQTKSGPSRAKPFPPTSSRQEGSSVTPSKNNQHEESSQTLTPASSVFNTPTPSRFKDVGVVHTEDSLVDDVLNLFAEEDVRLPSKTAAALRTLLGKHARRVEGNNKSKEVLRLRIKAEEAKNLELSLRNNTLQAELDVAKATVDHLNWEKEHGSDI